MLQEKAKKILEEAQRIELNNPKGASFLYLDASEVYLYLSQTNNPYSSKEFMRKAQECYQRYESLNSNKSLVEKSITKKTKTSSITFNDIGGLEDLKKEIRLRIIEPLKNPEVFKRFGKRIGGGIIMYGPPGCGKSLIAEATANEANATFFHVKASDLKSKYVGETEQNIAKLFEEAREKSPSIIFFDEFEVLGGDRSSTDQYTKQAISQLLTEMDGVGSKEDQILLLAATNEPWNIDIALRREGRFGRTLFIPPPDIESRAQILRLLLKNKPVDYDVDVNEIAYSTSYFSGADLKGLVESATDIPLTEFIELGRERKIARNDFKQVIMKQKPSSPMWFRIALAQLEKKEMIQDFTEVTDIAKELRESNMIVSAKV